jgi:hypothetical protein
MLRRELEQFLVENEETEVAAPQFMKEFRCRRRSMTGHCVK